MADPVSLLIFAIAATIAIALASAAFLRGWNGWLELRRLAMTQSGGPARPSLRELRERVRRLEAIASGAAD